MALKSMSIEKLITLKGQVEAFFPPKSWGNVERSNPNCPSSVAFKGQSRPQRRLAGAASLPNTAIPKIRPRPGPDAD